MTEQGIDFPQQKKIRVKRRTISEKAQDGMARLYGEFLSSGPFASGLHTSQSDILEVIRTFPGIEEVELDIKEADISVEA